MQNEMATRPIDIVVASEFIGVSRIALGGYGARWTGICHVVVVRAFVTKSSSCGDI